MSETSKQRRGSVDTERQKAIRASANHLRDLRRAHGSPPAEILVPSVAIPRRLAGEPTSSYCTSPAQLCAELVR